MGFKAELELDNKVYPLLLCGYEFSQTADHTGRPNPYITAGIIDIRVPMTRDDVLVDWVLQPSLMKKGKITIYKYDLSAIETTINFYNAHGLHYHLEFDAESAQAAYIDFRISAGELHLNELIHENRWNPERHQAIVTPREEETVLNPRIVSGWWSYDREGKDRYLQEKDGKKIALELGQSMYFHVETAEIPAGGELQLQLFDYDHFLWVDNLNYDTSKFPNDPVYKNAIVEAVEGKSIATVQVDLDDSWEPVITDDHDDPSIDQKIELYWDISYTKNDGTSISATMPRNQRDFLKVGYSTRDLYIQPAIEGGRLPEFYDKSGKLIIFAFKRANNMAKATGIEGAIENFVIYKVRVTTKTTMLSEINAIKREIFKEEINLATNESTLSKKYVIEEASSFVIKNSASYVDIDETTHMVRKKFSEYFNKVDFEKGTVRFLAKGRDYLRFLDYIDVAKTIHSIFPKEGMHLEIPKPSSVISIYGILGVADSFVIAGLGSLLLAKDVIFSKVSNEIMNDLKDYNRELLENAKLGGLNKLRLFLDTTITDKLIGFELIENIPSETHNKVMKGEVKTFDELDMLRTEETSDKYYSYLVQTIDNKKAKRKTYIIDSIYDQ